MYQKKLTAALLALTLTVSLSGCGDPFAEALLKNDSSLAAELETEHAATTAAPEMQEQTFEGETAAPETEPAAESPEAEGMGAEPGTDEALAEMQLVAHQFEQAAINQDWESYVDTYNIELLYYVQNHELGTREDYIKMIQEAVQGKNTPKTGAGANRGLFESEPVYCPEKSG